MRLSTDRLESGACLRIRAQPQSSRGRQIRAPRSRPHDFPGTATAPSRGTSSTSRQCTREYLYLTKRDSCATRTAHGGTPPAQRSGRDCAAYKGEDVQGHLNPQPANRTTVNFDGSNSGNVTIGHDVTQITCPVSTPADTTSNPIPGAPTCRHCLPQRSTLLPQPHLASIFASIC